MEEGDPTITVVVVVLVLRVAGRDMLKEGDNTFGVMMMGDALMSAARGSVSEIGAHISCI